MNNFSPSNLYIGIIDLFAILLPGSLVSLALYYFYREPVNDFLDIGEAHTGFYTAFAMLFSAYLFGHIISQMSAYLDEWVYDVFKDKVYKDHKAVEKITEIRQRKFGNVLDPVYVNNYKWSVYKLQKDSKEAASEVDRYMADSKFFRSLFLVLLVGLFILASIENKLLTAIAFSLVSLFILINVIFDVRLSTKQNSGNKIKNDKESMHKLRQNISILIMLIIFSIVGYLSIKNDAILGQGCAALAIFSMVRYFKKRRKSTETAYQYIIFQEELNSRI